MTHAGAVDGVPGREIVTTIEHHIGPRHGSIERVAGEAQVDRVDLDIRIHPRLNHDVQLERGPRVQRVSATLLHQLPFLASTPEAERETRSKQGLHLRRLHLIQPGPLFCFRDNHFVS